jgi:DNA-cytosine methyltransferase
MERNGVDVVANVEIDKQCQKVLAKHFPNAKQFSDITDVKGSDLIGAGFKPERGIITGGFPCQDLSVAGKRRGLAGERSGLFWEIARLIEETKTEWFILENVPGLLTSNKGADFGVVVGTMADIGYSLLLGGYLMLSTSEFPKEEGVSSSLADVLETDSVPQKYYLSPKACEGILRRTIQRGKTSTSNLTNRH